MPALRIARSERFFPVHRVSAYLTFCMVIW